MPTYTLTHIETDETKDHIVSYDEFRSMIDSGEYKHILKAPKIVSEHGSFEKHIPDGFNEVLNKVKKTSGRINTINTK